MGQKNLAESSSFWDSLSARPARRGIDSGTSGCHPPMDGWIKNKTAIEPSHKVE